MYDLLTHTHPSPSPSPFPAPFSSSHPLLLPSVPRYFKAVTRSNIVRGNVFHDGPRSGVNFNDGFAGMSK